VGRHRYYNISAIKPTGFCLECGAKLSGRRRKYCSDECSDKFFARYDYNGMVAQVLRRDDWTCRICGYRNDHNEGAVPSSYLREKRGVRRMEVDHIVAVADGGDPMDQANCRTLCERCHREVTAEWQRIRALKRRYGSAVHEVERERAEQPALF
jgi:5-methylcytosine-specific restriction endonuclease McrA